jgi:shikimate kinase
VLADPVLAEARFRERQPLYRRLARHTVETANLTPEETTQELLSILARLA